MLDDIDDIILQLENHLNEAEHKAEYWGTSRLSMGGVVNNPPFSEQLTLFEGDSIHQLADYIGSFNCKRDAYLAVAAVNALPKLIKEIKRLKLKE